MAVGEWAVILVQQAGAWAGCSPAQSPHRCTKYNSPPINDQCTNFILFYLALEFPVLMKGLKCASSGGRYKQRHGRERWKTLRAVGDVKPVTSTTVFGLLPDTTYLFMVLARNRLGDGLFSNVVVATTTGASPAVVVVF